MNAFQIVEALSTSSFGLIGIWAAVVRRHWFLWFIVVSVFLLSTVLITAHEVAIEFGIQIALIMFGVWIARNRGNWQFQFFHRDRPAVDGRCVDRLGGHR